MSSREEEISRLKDRIRAIDSFIKDRKEKRKKVEEELERIRQSWCEKDFGYNRVQCYRADGMLLVCVNNEVHNSSYRFIADYCPICGGKHDE